MMQPVNSGNGKKTRDEHLLLPHRNLSSNFGHSGLCNETSKMFSLGQNRPEPKTKSNKIHTIAASYATNGADELHRNGSGIVVDDAGPLNATDRLYYDSINGVTRLKQSDLRSQNHRIVSEDNLHESIKPPQHIQQLFVTTPLLSEKYPELLTIEHQDALLRKNDHLKRKLTSRDCSVEIIHQAKKSLKDQTNYSRVDDNNHSNDNTTSEQAPSMNAKRNQNLTVITSQLPNKKNTGNVCKGSPYNVYKAILKANGQEDLDTFASSSRYYSKISNLQKASYGNAIIEAALNRNCETLRKLMSQGLSPNPSNQFGDSLMNIVCKRGYFDVFTTLIECGASIKTCDQFDRSPLHFAASSPCLDLIEKILELDVDMLNARDKFGKTPLEYVTDQAHWDQCKKFLIEKQRLFWPLSRNRKKERATPNLTETSRLHATTPPLSDPHDVSSIHQDIATQVMRDKVLPDPDNALPEDMAKLISSGRSFR